MSFLLKVSVIVLRLVIVLFVDGIVLVRLLCVEVGVVVSSMIVIVVVYMVLFMWWIWVEMDVMRWFFEWSGGVG